MNNDQKVLLKVEHLEQYFKLGPRTLKAVDDVNFEINKGEVFGLVGESGCGKTTTGRSIIRLYDITGGSIYFDGKRICAGIRPYKAAIKAAKAKYHNDVDVATKNAKIESLKLIDAQENLSENDKNVVYKLANQCDKYVLHRNIFKWSSISLLALVIIYVSILLILFDKLLSNVIVINFAIAAVLSFVGLILATICLSLNSAIKDFIKIGKHISSNFNMRINNKLSFKLKTKLDEQIKIAEQELHVTVSLNTEKIKAAIDDHKNCNKKFAQYEMDKVKNRFEPLIAKCTNEEQLKSFKAQYKKELKLASKDRIMNKIQMIFQDPIASLDPRMTVHDIIAEGLVIRGVKDKQFIDNEVYRVLELVGLVPEHASRYPHEFSGGQRQRIGIARAIILNPELIIADEPISALDVSIQAQVINLLNELRDKMGLTILFIAHDLSVVKYFSDRIAVMYYGKIVELATSDELFAHPLHPYTKSLLSAIPLPDPHYEKNRKRIVYNPLADHDYSIERPIMREITPGHFISCNSAEFEKYKKEIKA